MTDKIDIISHFEEAINKETCFEIENILAAARKQADDMLACEDDKLLEASYHLVSDSTKKIVEKTAQTVSQASFSASKDIVAHRNNIVEVLFAGIIQKIKEWTKTPEYAVKLEKMVSDANAEQKFYSEVVLNVKLEDLAAAQKIAAAYGVKAQADRTIKLGGVSVYYPAEHRYIDKTLDDAFQAQKNGFVNNPEMQL